MLSLRSKITCVFCIKFQVPVVSKETFYTDPSIRTLVWTKLQRPLDTRLIVILLIFFTMSYSYPILHTVDLWVTFWNINFSVWAVLAAIKFSKSQKQNTKFSLTQKNQRNIVHFFALASKKWLKQKIKALDDLNL